MTSRFAFVRIDDPAVSPDDCEVVAIQTGETIGIVGMNEDRQRCALRINTEEVAAGFASWREAALWLARQTLGQPQAARRAYQQIIEARPIRTATIVSTHRLVNHNRRPWHHLRPDQTGEQQGQLRRTQRHCSIL